MCSNVLIGYNYADALHFTIERLLTVRSLIIIHLKSVKQEKAKWLELSHSLLKPIRLFASEVQVVRRSVAAAALLLPLKFRNYSGYMDIQSIGYIPGIFTRNCLRWSGE